MGVHYLCPHCGGEILTFLGLRRYVAIFNGEAGYSAQCPWCDQEITLDKAWLKQECDIAFFSWLLNHRDILQEVGNA